jgi:superfamily II DNA or RNA helicase
MIYEEDEIVLYHLLSTKGLLNLENRHTQFFKNLIEARRTDEGRKAIEEYVNSDSEIPPDLSEEEEIGTASSQEIANLVENETDPLDYGKIKTPQQIFAQSDRLESYTEDIESMQFYVNKSIKDLWASAFRDKENTISDVRRDGKNGNKYHDRVLETFLSDYERAQSIEIPKGYAFRKDERILPPTLMQRYVAYKIKTNRRFGNFSGTGAGKTLSAVLASRVIDSKMTLIICPNDVVNQWENNILEIFPDSVVIIRKEAFYEKYDENKHKYLVINYDLFSQPYSPNLILNLVKQKVDFVVLDEIHFTKKRDEKKESKRRHNIEGLMTDVSKKNSDVKVLGLSATPVVNELEEGKSLLQLITGKIYDDISTRPTPQNAVKLYEKLSLISIREIPQYNISVLPEHIDVETDIRKSKIRATELIRNPLTVERLASDAKIPEIMKHIQGPTIIYTEYVTDIIEKLSKAVEDAGYTYAKYTGEDHSGLKRFLDKKVQVLIASRPISTGVDGLQHICNNLIINTLPWTNVQYQQHAVHLLQRRRRRQCMI